MVGFPGLASVTRGAYGARIRPSRVLVLGDWKSSMLGPGRHGRRGAVSMLRDQWVRERAHPLGEAGLIKWVY